MAEEEEKEERKEEREAEKKEERYPSRLKRRKAPFSLVFAAWLSKACG